MSSESERQGGGKGGKGKKKKKAKKFKNKEPSRWADVNLDNDKRVIKDILLSIFIVFQCH